MSTLSGSRREPRLDRLQPRIGDDPCLLLWNHMFLLKRPCPATSVRRSCIELTASAQIISRSRFSASMSSLGVPIGQNRRLPVVSRRTHFSLVVPANTHCRGSTMSLRP